MSKPRSLAQLRYCFGVVMKDLMAYTAARGTHLSKEQVKETVYIAVGHCEMVEVFGQYKVVAKRTPKETQPLEELMEKIRAWAAGLNPPCEILLPNEGITYPAWKTIKEDL